jgi:hypothetical protein
LREKMSRAWLGGKARGEALEKRWRSAGRALEERWKSAGEALEKRWGSAGEALEKALTAYRLEMLR